MIMIIIMIMMIIIVIIAIMIILLTAVIVIIIIIINNPFQPGDFSTGFTTGIYRIYRDIQEIFWRDKPLRSP